MEAAIPAFSKHISHVVALCADKKVCRIDASSVITAMQDTSAVSPWKDGNRPEMDLPTDAVGRTLPIIANGKHTVAGICWCRYPVPTRIADVRKDIRPKARGYFGISDNYSMPELAASCRAISLARLPCNGTFFDQKLIAAGLAFEGDAGAWVVIATSGRAETRRSISLAEHGAAHFARRIAMFDRWCHEAIVALTDNLRNIIRKYGLAGLMAAGSGATLPGMGER